MVHWSQLLTHCQERTQGSDHYSPNTHWMADHSWKKSVCIHLKYWACLWGLLGTESYHCNCLGIILARFQDLSQGNSMMKPSLNVLSIHCHRYYCSTGKAYSTVYCTIDQPKYFLVKFPQLHKGLWAKRSVHPNYLLGIFYHVPKALNLVIKRQSRLKWPTTKLLGHGKIYPDGTQNRKLNLFSL